MKKLLFIFTLVLAGTFTQSCEEFLTEELTTDVTADNYYVTASGFEDGVKAMYWALDRVWGSEMGMTIGELGTDFHTNGADGSHKGFNVYDSRMSPTGDSYVNGLWVELYRAINQCNGVIGRSGDVQGMDGALVASRVGEAKFLRGLYYFALVQSYDNIVLTLEETKGIETDVNQVDPVTVYDQAIIPDWTDAMNALPESQNDYGRATKWAAQFMLAKAYLTKGHLTGSAGDFAQAQSLMENLIANSSHSLLPNWADLWDQGNQDNAEVIFSVQNSTNLILNASLGSSGHRFHLYFLMEYDKLPGMTRDTENGRPWKRARPTRWGERLWNDDQSVDQALGTRADIRYQDGYKHVWFANNPGTYTVKDAAGTRDINIALGDTALFIPNIQVSNEFRNAKAYRIYTPDEYNEKIYPTLNKFIDPLRDNRQRTQGSRDFIIARLADAYLCAAEAALMQGDVATATAHINTIRLRAARPGREADMEVTEAQVDMDFLLDERARELTGEMHRWWDLKRTGKLVERVKLYNPQASPNIQDRHTRRPIPQTEIDAVNSLGGTINQNSGY